MAEDIRVNDYNGARICSVANDVGVEAMEWLDCPLWLTGVYSSLGAISISLQSGSVQSVATLTLMHSSQGASFAPAFLPVHGQELMVSVVYGGVENGSFYDLVFQSRK